MNTEQLRGYKGETVVVDNNILTDFMEINAALDYDYISLLNKLFSEVKILLQFWKMKISMIV